MIDRLGKLRQLVVVRVEERESERCQVANHGESRQGEKEP